MSRDRLMKPTADLYPPSQAGGNAQVQLKQAIGALPYNEQVQRLRPPLPLGAGAPVQMKADSAPVQFEGGDDAGCCVPDTVSGTSVSIDAAGTVSIVGSSVEILAPTIDLTSACVRVPGVLEAGVVIADSVVGANYSPGAGNVL